MVKRVRKMSGGLKGKLAMALVVLALLSVAFCLVFWMFLKKNQSEKQHMARISELERILADYNAEESEPEEKEAEPTLAVVAEHIRLSDYAFISISPVVSEGDFVDVRIRFDDGSDYVVASHKQIIALDRDKGSLVFSVSEEEILMLSSAEKDKKEYAGTKVYLTRYNMGEETVSIVDYIPSTRIAELIHMNPNVMASSLRTGITDRERLEEELKKYKGIQAGDGSTVWEETENYQGSLSDLPDEYRGSIWD